jgi:signal transduction histidine kinase/CheY-like chemotaxis protein
MILKFIQMLGLALGYTVLALGGLSLAFEQTNASPVWPPSGFAFAALLILGKRFWPSIWVGAFSANLITFMQGGGLELVHAAGMSLVIACGNTGEAVVGCLLFEKMRRKQKWFRSVWNVFSLVIVGMVACAVSAGVGVATLYFGGAITANLIIPIFLTWWIGDLVGVYILTPLCCELYSRSADLWPRKRVAEWLGMTLLLLFLCTVVFGGLAEMGLITSMPYLVIPILLWFAYRFEALETTVASFIVCTMAVWHTIKGSGPLSSTDLNQSLVLLQTFVGVISIISLAVVAAFSERRKAVEALEKLNAELEERIRERTSELNASTMKSEQLAIQAQQANLAKSMFLASISHEIRTPLNGIMGFANILGETELDADQRKSLLQISESGETLVTLIEDILYLAELESGKVDPKLESTQLKPFLEHCLELVQQYADGKGLCLKLKLEEGVPESIKLDPRSCKQILHHLLTNALKFTDSGSVALECQYDFKSSQEGLLYLAVEDTGMGISAEHHGEIFKAFTQADETIHERFGGTGLGLAVCDRLARAMKGKIELRSQPKMGSRFTLSLPVSVPLVEEQTKSTVSACPVGPVSNLQILVAEDNAINRKVAKQILERRGHHVCFAHNGIQAIEQLKQTDFDLILMDIQMPQLDGVGATQQIRKGAAGEKKADIPIVALTAYTRVEDQRKFMQAGMNAYLSKPIQIDELTKVLAEYADKAKVSKPV